MIQYLKCPTPNTANDMKQASLSQNDILQHIINQPLAFSSSSTLVAASSRLPFATTDNTATLNVELFEFNPSPSAPLLLFVHGICVSCETISVQNLVSAAKIHGVNVAVLELEGHGISSGRRGFVHNFDRFVRHVLEFVSNTLIALTKPSKDINGEIPYVIGGNSFGGILSAYAASTIVKKPSSIELRFPGRFLGVAPLSPAVGVDPKAIPSFYVVQALKLLAFVAPGLQPSLTPLEDPVACNCPPDTERNFAGHWPLATSKLLLDVTSNRVRIDLNRSKSDRKKLDLAGVPSVMVIAGEADDTVPFELVKVFYDELASMEKEIVAIPEAGHDLLTVKLYCNRATEALFRWLNKLAEDDSY